MTTDPRRAQNPNIPSRRNLFGGVSVAPMGIPPAPMGSQQPAALYPDQGTPVRLPGVNFAPAGSLPLDVPGDDNLAPGATGVLLTIPVPNGLRCRISGIGFGADDEVALRFLTWSIRFDGDATPHGYGRMPAAIGSIRQLAPIVLVIPGSVTATVVAIIDAGAVLTYRYIARAIGWFYADYRGR